MGAAPVREALVHAGPPRSGSLAGSWPRWTEAIACLGSTEEMNCGQLGGSRDRSCTGYSPAGADSAWDAAQPALGSVGLFHVFISGPLGSPLALCAPQACCLCLTHTNPVDCEGAGILRTPRCPSDRKVWAGRAPGTRSHACPLQAPCAQGHFLSVYLTWASWVASWVKRGRRFPQLPGLFACSQGV